MKENIKKIKNWSWMVMLAYMLGLSRPYREEEDILSIIEVRIDEEEEPPIGVDQLTYQEAEFYHRTGFDYFYRN